MHSGRRLFLISILILVIMNVLCVMELHNLRDHLLENTAAHQEQYLLLMEDRIQQEQNPIESVSSIFTKDYETSSRSFGVVLEGEEIVFYRDSASLKMIEDNGGQADYNTESSLGDHSSIIDVAKGARYIMSYVSFEANGNPYSIAIMSEEEYVLETSNYASYSRHYLLFMILFSIAEIIFVFQLYRRNIAQTKEIDEWIKTEKENRQQIENLVKNLQIAQNERIEDSTFGVLQKRAFIRVIEQMSKEQQMQSSIIRIKVKVDDADAMIYMASILQRIEILKCISCKWGEKEYCILSLNNDTIQLENILRYVLSAYTKDYGRDAEEIMMSTQKVRSEDHGIPTV